MKKVWRFLPFGSLVYWCIEQTNFEKEVNYNLEGMKGILNILYPIILWILVVLLIFS